MTTKTVTIGASDFAAMMGDNLKRRVIAEGLTPGERKSFIIAIDLDLAGDVSMRRTQDGSYIFTQRIEDGVTGGKKSAMEEFDAQREKALKTGAD